MKYKTTIEIYTDAANEKDAVDMAGEYLRGNLNGDTPMDVKAVTLRKLTTVRVVGALCAVVMIAASLMAGNHAYYNMARTDKKEVTSYAVQPPLKIGSEEFKEAWEKEQSKVINSFSR